jgi:Na+-driven multidrug efflux pump
MPNKANPDFLGKRPVGALLWEFSFPSIVAAFVSASYNIVARIFVGQKIGALGIAALHVSYPFMLLALAFAMMITTGASTLISIELGKKDHDKAEKILGQALVMFLVVSGVFLVFGLLFLEPMLILFGASEEILPLAKEYLSIIIWGVVFQEISYGVNNFIRIEGKPRIAMTTMILSAVLNGLFDYLFLFVFETGIWGSAVANLIALASTSLWVCGYYFSGRTVLKWRRRYLRIHFPSGLQRPDSGGSEQSARVLRRSLRCQSRDGAWR